MTMSFKVDHHGGSNEYDHESLYDDDKSNKSIEMRGLLGRNPDDIDFDHVDESPRFSRRGNNDDFYSILFFGVKRKPGSRKEQRQRRRRRKACCRSICYFITMLLGMIIGVFVITKLSLMAEEGMEADNGSDFVSMFHGILHDQEAPSESNSQSATRSPISTKYPKETKEEKEEETKLQEDLDQWYMRQHPDLLDQSIPIHQESKRTSSPTSSPIKTPHNYSPLSQVVVSSPSSSSSSTSSLSYTNNKNTTTVKNEESNHYQTSSTQQQIDSISVLHMKRIFVSIPSYEYQKTFCYLDDMIDSFRDLCHSGAKVFIQLYITSPLSVEQINLFNAKNKCFHPDGAFEIHAKIKPLNLKFHFVDAHRKDFYENLDSYDLFIYTEDDHYIRPTHVAAYFHHTQKLYELTGEAFPNYSIGFLRYERDLENAQKLTFDQYLYKYAGLHSFGNPALLGLYVGNTRMPYQGMFMATQDQLRNWKTKCEFDNVQNHGESKEIIHREYVASLALFSNDGVKKESCNVTQLFPIESFQDFLLHHMADKYITNANFERENSMSPQDLQRYVSKVAYNSPVDSSFLLSSSVVDGTKDEIYYDGVEMEIEPEDVEEMSRQDDGETQVQQVLQRMAEYQKYKDRLGLLDGL